MTVLIGPYPFDGATGTPRRPLSSIQASTWRQNAGAFRWQGNPTGDCGAVEAWLDCTEVDAQVRILTLTALVGQRIDVAFEGGTVAGVPLAEVTGEWAPKAGTQHGGVLVIQCRFDTAADGTGGDAPDEDLSTAYVETARALAGPWTARPGWIAESAAEGLGLYVGESEAYVLGEGPDDDLIGAWVRLVDRGTDNPRWYGVIVGASMQAQTLDGVAQDARTTYRFAGVASVLHQAFLPSWWESRTSDGPDDGGGDLSNLADVGSPLPFNGDGRDDMGPPAPVPGDPLGEDVPIHARGAPIARWTAGDAVRCILAHVRAAWGFRVVLDAAGVDLSYDGSWSVVGSPLVAITSILHPDADRSFRVEVDPVEGGLVIVAVDLSSLGDVVDLTDDSVTAWDIDRDGADTVDRLYVEGPRPWWVATIGHQYDERGALPGGSALWRGWAQQQETDFGGLLPEDLDQNALGYVWRRLVLRWNWQGMGFAGFGAPRVPYVRAVDAQGQETGELEFGAPASAYPHARAAWTINRTMPLGPGKDWVESTAFVEARDDQEGPLVFWHKPGERWEFAHFDYQIRVTDDNAGVIVGRTGEEAEAIRQRLVDDDFRLAATLSFLHPFAYRVSAVAAVAPRDDLIRSGGVFVHGEHWQRTDVAADTVYDINDDGDPVFADPGRKDTGGDLVDVRERLRRYRMTPAGAVSWVVDGIEAEWDLGFVVSGATVRPTAGGSAVDVTLPIDAPIARRSWSLRPGEEATTYAASRVAPGVMTPFIAAAGLDVGDALRRTESDFLLEATRR